MSMDAMDMLLMRPVFISVHWACQALSIRYHDETREWLDIGRLYQQALQLCPAAHKLESAIVVRLLQNLLASV